LAEFRRHPRRAIKPQVKPKVSPAAGELHRAYYTLLFAGAFESVGLATLVGIRKKIISLTGGD